MSAAQATLRRTAGAVRRREKAAGNGGLLTFAYFPLSAVAPDRAKPTRDADADQLVCGATANAASCCRRR